LATVTPSPLSDGGGLLEGGRVHPQVTAQIAATRGRGAPLSPDLQTQLSASLGESFSDVRVHTDPLASQLARSVEARAFTTGSDIYFAQGEYAPNTSSGQALLLHEVRHAQQQRGAPTTGELRVSEPGDTFERDAESFAASFGL
jgi:Domain of unknown function (DUF4157)